MNPSNPRHRENLLRAMKTSRDSLRPFRESREKMVRQYVGSNWGEGSGSNASGKREVLANWMNLTADTYTMSLAANKPRVLLSATDLSLVAFSKRFQVAVNNLIQEIHLEETLRRIVLDAFFTVGIAKVYTADMGKEVEIANPDFPDDPGEFAGFEEWEKYSEAQRSMPQTIWMDPGKPFVERVSLDDWVHDTQATDWEKIRFAAHYYRVTYESMKSDDRFDKNVVGMLGPSSKWGGYMGSDGESEVKAIANYDRSDHDELEPMIDLMDVWIPGENKWCVFPRDKNTPPLLVEDWDGPETGPFHLLTYSDVPDNIMPSSPAQNLAPLAGLMNSLMRKQANQARRQKDITLFRGDGKDARGVQQAKDGEMVRSSDPSSTTTLKQGGVDQMNMAFYHGVEGIYSRMAGNLDAMAGLGPQSDTLGQDKLIHSAVSKREAKMQFKVVAFTERIVRDLGWMLWVDSVKSMPGQYDIEGVPGSIDAPWTPEDREGDYLDYNFKVEPYSQAYKSPSERAQFLMSVITQLVIPAQLPIDFEKTIDILAELNDMPRLKEIVRFPSAGSDDSNAPPQGQPPRPANTNRTYTHQSVPTGGSPQSQRNAMGMALMGAANQDQVNSLSQ